MSRFNLREVQRLDPSARLNRYVEIMQKHKDSESWKQIVLHILRQEDKGNQYTVMKTVLSKMRHGDKRIFTKISPSIDTQFDNCQSMGAIFVLAKYLLTLDNQSSNYFIENGYRTGLRKFGLFEREIKHMEGMSHIDNDNPIFAEIESAVQVTPNLYNKLKLTFQLITLKPFLSWLSIYRARNYDYCVILDDFCKFLVMSCANANKFIGQYDISGIGRLLIELLNKCLQTYPNCQNMCLILQHMSDLQIQTAILSFQNDFKKYSSANILKFSTVLTRSSIGPKTIKLIFTLSKILKNSNMQNKLFDIFKQFIIKKILGWGKVSSNAQNQIQQLVNFYIDGFIEAVPDRQQCVNLILLDLSKINSKNQSFWIKTMYQIAFEDPELCLKIQKQCKVANPIKKEQYEKIKSLSWKDFVNSNNLTSSRRISSDIKQQSTSNLPPRAQQLGVKLTRPFFEDSPEERKSIQVPASMEYIPRSAQKPLESRVSNSMIISSQNNVNKQSYLLSTPQQHKTTIPFANSDGFQTRSPVETNRKTIDSQSRIPKTATRFSVQTGSSMLSRMQPPIKKAKQSKITLSKLSLIPNKSTGYNTNYVDMAVMLLFALQRLPFLLDDIKQQILQNKDKYKLLNELQQIFVNIANFQGKKVNLTNFMKLGPSEYQQTNKQFQICQYMTKLFIKLLEDFDRIPARYNSAQKFKQLFEIVIKQETSCPNCQAPHDDFVNTYYITNATHQTLKTQWSNVRNFTCQKCKSTAQSAFINRIISSPTLMIVQLQNQNKPRQSLPRVWNNSRLVAIVIGSPTSSLTGGQYRFYYRNLKNPLTWIQFTFSYGQALQFNIQQQNQQFQSKFIPSVAIYLQNQ